MGTVHYAAFHAIILIFQVYSVTGNISIPFLSPLLGNNNPCRESVCGKGNCVVSSNSTFGYECECDSGWKQAAGSQDDDYLKFLPCVIPNCTLDYSCANAPAPVSDNHTKANLSFLDPCFWTYCGGGSCNKTSVFTHTCECEEGYYNLFNSTAFPCYKEFVALAHRLRCCWVTLRHGFESCKQALAKLHGAFGLDCANLGLDINNSTTLRPDTSPSSADDSKSHAVSLIPRVDYGWLIGLSTTLALVLLW
ncbi:hypothetical protein OROMI_005002 [Orobanche minor]